MSQGYTVVLESQHKAGGNLYLDTDLPFKDSSYRPKREYIPDRIRDMQQLRDHGRIYAESRAEKFYRQAVFMADYEDNVTWTGNFACYFPTYRDLNTAQLRGYFTWRTDVRRGEFRQIPASAAYIYIYELLNGIGTSSPEDALGKLCKFKEGYVDAGFGDERMKQNIYRWALDLCVLNDIPPEAARQVVSPELVEGDKALFILKDPAGHNDEEVFAALTCLGGKKAASSPVIKEDPARAALLFSEAWRAASDSFSLRGNNLFTLCFGEKKRRQWWPLSNAVYYEQSKPEDREYVLDESRSFICRNGIWQVITYEKISFDLARLQGFLHETDARLRRYRKTGRYLKENPADAWADPYIDSVIEADRKAAAEAARPKITIDLFGLEQIRKDADSTRDSLLTEEELAGSEEVASKEETIETRTQTDENPEAEEQTDLPLNAVQIRILRCLLQGRDVSAIIKDDHLLPSIVADAINEALFDEIGDTVVECEGDRLELVEDYIEDMEQLLGGNANG